MSSRFPSGGFPNGWYVLCLARDLKPRQVRGVRHFDRDWVLYRTAGGTPRLVDSVCPHLGAHLGLARVEGENLVCSMHGFEFDASGQCVKLAYGTRPPPKAHLVGSTLREVNGLLLVWFASDGSPPAWEIEPLDWHGFTDFRYRRLEFGGHPQEITENSCDLGHFPSVHGYDRSWVEAAPAVDGAKLTAVYGARRSLAPIGFPRAKIDSRFAVTAHGLGYSLVEGSVPGTPVDSRFFVCSIPVDRERVHLHLAVRVRTGPLPGLSVLVREAVFRGLCHDVGQDVPFWESKRYIEQPLLAEGDGPIPLYRRWAAQFYPDARRLQTLA